MKKWMLPVLLLILLAACNASPNNETGQANEKEDYPEKEENQDSENNREEDEPASTQEKEDPISENEEKPGNNKEETEEKSTTDPKTNEKQPQMPQYTLNPKDSSIQPIGDANSDVVLLTIDDAPDRYALEMATTLMELKVKAIFFVNGHFLQTEEEQAILREIHDMGFPIGNHTMNHKSLRQITEEEQYEEIVGLSNLLEEIIGERPRFFRAPFGINTDYSDELAVQEGMVRMNWTYGYDWEKEYTNAEAITKIMINADALQSGANLLMHDREWTNEALADIVKGLQEKGYEIVDPALIEVPSE